ncbi:MAG: LamG-like jellyroll fold domain-containing protein, partial [Planctomycetota bacterium]
MSRKLTCLISVVLALALTSPADAQESGLAGWWKLDGNANDSSGNNNRGTLVGNPQWAVGQIGEALSFDGADDHVDCGNGPSLDITGPITIAAWFYPTGQGSSTYPRIVDKSNGTGGADPGYKLYLRSADNYVLTLSAGGVYPISALAADLNAWNFAAFITDGTQRKLFLNGEWQEWSETALPTSSTNPLYIGNSPAGARHFQGMIDEVRVYSRALTADEVLKAMRGPIPPNLASGPIPADGETDVERDVTLSWTPGVYAAPLNGHTVYLSENLDDVNNGVGGTTQSTESYTPPQPLDFDTTYYWRVDEVNAPPSSAVHEGEVWSFTTEPLAYPIENIIATASSSNTGTLPENTVNGSGLDEEDLHSTNEEDMWLSGTEPLGAWIQYEFEKVYVLHQMQVWNHNSRLESVIGFGIKEATVEYSADGTDWLALGPTHEFAQA